MSNLNNNNNNEYKERDEIDTYFSDAKKKDFPFWLIFIVILFVIVGCGVYYYFVIDSPQNIFLSVFKDNVKNNVNFDKDNINYDFSFSTNITTNDKDYLEIVDIFNKLSVTGSVNQNSEEEKYNLKLNSLYEEDKMFTINTYLQDDVLYLNLDNLYDKTIKFDLDELETSEDLPENNDSDDVYNDIVDLLIENINKTFKNINFEKKYVKLDNNYVKKILFDIDKQVVSDFYNNLLNDDEFMKKYSEYNGMTESELEEQIKEEITNLDDDIIEISLYVSLIENEFIKLEINLNQDESRIIITEEDNKYDYKYYENSIIKYQGYVMVENNDNDYQISLSSLDVEEQINVELNLDLSFKTEEVIEDIDTGNVIDYSLLTEEDLNNILLKLMEDKTVLKLLEDINAVLGE